MKKQQHKHAHQYVVGLYSVNKRGGRAFQNALDQVLVPVSSATLSNSTRKQTRTRPLSAGNNGKPDGTLLRFGARDEEAGAYDARGSWRFC